MALFAFFAVSVLAATAVRAAGQEGFLSIDCGLDDAYSGRTDADTNIAYVSDSPYVDGGENHMIAADQESSAYGDMSLRTLRSFPSGQRNCYTLPTQSGGKYLVRMEFFYGNYDGQNRSLLQFELYLGTNHWDTYQLYGAGYGWSEAIFVAWASWVPLCLVSTGSGTPFVNTVELRPLGPSLYRDASTVQSLAGYNRGNPGGDTLIRFPDDPYDRLWGSRTLSTWEYLSTNMSVTPDDTIAVPIPVLQTAAVAINNGTVLHVKTLEPSNTALEFVVYLHFADFQNTQLRQFDVHISDQFYNQYTPAYLSASYVYSSALAKTSDDKYNISLVATNISALPPMINAYEIYALIRHNTPRTFSKDFDAMMAIKLEYGIKKNWMGDPCSAKYAWDGVKCRNMTDITMRIISLDLSGNSLNGPIPYTLCKKNTRPLVFRYESGEDMCNKTISPPPSRNKTTIISISIVVPIVAVALLVFSYLIWRRKVKPKISTRDLPREQVLMITTGSTKSHGDNLQNTENRRFTYKELENVTNKFERFIGQGGFGLVYYGRLEDDSEVAVKMRSESSTHGFDVFLAEVHILTKVHHRNVVSLVGYCVEKDHLALVYEYMSRGNLCDHLRGKNGHETFHWAIRIRVVLEAAQGLDYLHKGCNFPIIHRDVKTSNILLGQNLQAKVADFGLSKTYLSETQTHISTNAAGSTGYFDPEYYHTGRLTESSDVYSFGVVLLEIVTGEPPILPGHGHIVQRVKQKMATGNISSVADVRLSGAYEVTSMWKVVDIAMACTADTSVRRPTMAAVVAQLKESLALEEARDDSSVRVSPTSDTAAFVSTFGPSAR
ncbi:unnamed protein product [Alopecurus aequalis]